MPPKLADIPGDVAPNEFTDDPVLGRAERVVGYGVKNMVAFTFDDGPVGETTPQILETLAHYDVPASFFVVMRHFRNGLGLGMGYTVLERALLEREVEYGHLVGSHAVHHNHLLDVQPADLDREIDGSLRELAQYTHQPIGMFRPPFGKLSWSARKRLKSLGVTEVFWSIDPRDWAAEPGDEAALRRKIAREIWGQGGGVVILHDSKAITARILPSVLDDLEAANCRRIANHQEPMLPVSLHYFLQDGDAPRPVPAEVEARTQAYRDALPDRCRARAKAVRSGRR
jgi:peptidoglycan/xylan/chitin deacetylase (PgdA/CDA1 family)